MPCLDKLWTKESGWNHLARNSSSGAYGIPQAYAGQQDGLARAPTGRPTRPPRSRGVSSYITGRYGTPCGAYQFSQATGLLLTGPWARGVIPTEG